MEACAEAAVRAPAALLESYRQFTDILNNAAGGWLAAFEEEQRDLDEYRAALQTLQQAAGRVERCSYDTEAFGLIKVHAGRAKASLAAVVTSLRDGLAAQLKARMRESNGAILVEAARIVARLQAEPQSAEELDVLKKYVNAQSGDDRSAVEAAVLDAGACFTLLHDVCESVEDDDSQLAWSAAACPKSIASTVQRAHVELVSSSKHFMDALLKQTRQFSADLQQNADAIEKIKQQVGSRVQNRVGFGSGPGWGVGEGIRRGEIVPLANLFTLTIHSNASPYMK